ncbi:MAG: hypothetical protein JO141_03495 [Bradyrhizobium sp.]|nr:hypothetical protein [Bradyrhizobium sp.]
MSNNGNRSSNFLRELTDAASRNPLSAALIGMGTLWFVGERAWEGAVRPTLDQASDVIGSAKSQVRRYRESTDQPGLTELFRRQPLALGILGAAIGAGLAAALPLTRKESELLGESSDELKAKAREAVEKQAGRVGDAAERALHAAADEAEKQGLTPEGLKSAKESVASKVGHVMDAANEGIRKRNGGPARSSSKRGPD